MEVSEGYLTNPERPRGYYSRGVFEVKSGKIYDISLSPKSRNKHIEIEVPHFIKKKYGFLEHDFYHSVAPNGDIKPCQNRNLQQVRVTFRAII